MGYRTIIGFESGGTGECAGASAADAVAVTSPTRTGTYALECTPTTTETGYVTIGDIGANGRQAAFDDATLYYRFYLYITTTPSATDGDQFFVVQSGTTTQKAALHLTSSRTIKIYNSSNTLITTTAAISASEWHRIEVRCGTGTSNFELQVDGSSLYSTSTFSCGAGNNAYCRLGKYVDRNSSASYVLDFDDVAISDSGWCGAGGCGPRGTATADGSTQQWLSGTGASDWNEVATIDTADYVMNAASANKIALFGMDSGSGVPGYAGKTINCLKAYIYTREDVTGTSGTQIRVRSGSTNSTSTAYNGTTSMANQFRVLPLDPNTGAAWTEAAMDAVEIGAVETTTVQIRFAYVGIYVDYKDAPITANIPLETVTVTKRVPTAVNTTADSQTANIPLETVTIANPVPDAVVTTVPNPNTSNIALETTAVTKPAPSAVTTENHIANIAAGVIADGDYLRTPVITLTANNVSLVAVTAKTVTKYVPECVIPAIHNTSNIPLETLTVTKPVPDAVRTELTNPNTANIALETLTVTKPVPTAVRTELTNPNTADVPLETVTVTKYVPEAVVAQANTSNITTATATKSSLAPTAVVTTNNVADVPVESTAVAKPVPSAVTTEKHIVNVPLETLTVTKPVPTAINTTADSCIANIPAGVIVDGDYLRTPVITVTAHNAILVDLSQKTTTFLAPTVTATDLHTVLIPLKTVAMAKPVPTVESNTQIAEMWQSWLTVTCHAPTVTSVRPYSELFGLTVDDDSTSILTVSETVPEPLQLSLTVDDDNVVDLTVCEALLLSETVSDVLDVELTV